MPDTRGTADGVPGAQSSVVERPHSRRATGETTDAFACRPESGTTGEAHWQLDSSELRGTLHVRLGGKNMTFDQRHHRRAARSMPRPGRRGIFLELRDA